MTEKNKNVTESDLKAAVANVEKDITNAAKELRNATKKKIIKLVADKLGENPELPTPPVEVKPTTPPPVKSRKQFQRYVVKIEAVKPEILPQEISRLITIEIARKGYANILVVTTPLN